MEEIVKLEYTLTFMQYREHDTYTVGHFKIFKKPQSFSRLIKKIQIQQFKSKGDPVDIPSAFVFEQRFRLRFTNYARFDSRWIHVYIEFPADK